MIPSPPDLKPTIIQMQNNDNKEEDSSAISEKPQVDTGSSNGNDEADKPKKKRRRSSSSLVSQNEIEKRRREHKTAHSIIEKKRRIRMNREFEALKFLVPACRNNLNTSNNGGEGMYKLTILQATVDYIKYLHNVINIQQDELCQHSQEWALENLDFAKVDVNTDEYRCLENDFDFNKLFDGFNNSQRSSLSSEMKCPSPMNVARSQSISYSVPMSRGCSSRNSIRPQPQLETRRITNSSANTSSECLTSFQSLPSPIITPELYPCPTSHPASKVNAITQSSNADTGNYNISQSMTFKKDFQFPMNPSITKLPQLSENSIPLSFPRFSEKPAQTFEQLPVTAINEQVVKLHSIHEVVTEKTATNALISMKKDGSITSIRSLLN